MPNFLRKAIGYTVIIVMTIFLAPIALALLILLALGMLLKWYWDEIGGAGAP